MKIKEMARMAACAIAAQAFAACSTEVELCEENLHPHYASVKYDYDWQSNTQKPDSMYVIAYRVINYWKSAVVVDTETKFGHYLFNAPPLIEEDGGEEPLPDDTPAEDGDGTLPDDTPAEDGGQTDTEQDEEPKEENNSIDVFRIKEGTYKFITFNMDTTELKYDDVIRYMTSDANDLKLQDLYVEYKNYSKESKELNYILKGWDDYNPYANYIQPNMRPVYFDTIPARTIVGKDVKTLTFKPNPLTQNIDIYFDIKKDISNTKFIIDSVVAEVSGVPSKINLSNGYIDITKTYKMMFHTKLTDSNGNLIEDTETNKAVSCYANINVASIVQSISETVRTGPGIMQVVIYTHAKDGNETYYKVIQGKINLFNTLENADLIEYTLDGFHAKRKKVKGELKVKVEMVIDGKSIKENPDNSGGIDRWEDCTERIIIDI